MNQNFNSIKCNKKVQSMNHQTFLGVEDQVREAGVSMPNAELSIVVTDIQGYPSKSNTFKYMFLMIYINRKCSNSVV